MGCQCGGSSQLTLTEGCHSVSGRLADGAHLALEPLAFCLDFAWPPWAVVDVLPLPPVLAAASAFTNGKQSFGIWSYGTAVSVEMVAAVPEKPWKMRPGLSPMLSPFI